eukprot:TRINITY_DN64805_c0_g1_i1.p1 TRINITY_DN64805_c0_g1~~TRINITY_DN64805_c0_g1_i1.p1  ORF type:complete len:448 (+),score=97.00 TRINITY_DN64805_c0_g1_i1:58-1401(+)
MALDRTMVASEQEQRALERERVAREMRASAARRQAAVLDLDSQPEAATAALVAGGYPATAATSSTAKAATEPLLKEIGRHAERLQVAAATLREADLRVAILEVARDLEGLRAEAARSAGAPAKSAANGNVRPDEAEVDPAPLVELRTLTGHKDAVHCVVACGAGHLVTGCDEGTLRVWEVASGQCLEIIQAHSDAVLALTALDGEHVLSASKDGKLKAWTLAGVQLGTFSGHRRGVLGVAALGDLRFVSGGMDKTLRLWDASQGWSSASLSTLEGHKDALLCVAALGSQHAVSGSADKSLKVWDIQTGSCILTLEGHQQSVVAVAASSAVAGDDATAPTAEAALQGRRVVSASKDMTVRLWELAGGLCLATFAGHTTYVQGVAWLSSDRAVSCSSDKTLKLWDVAGGRCYGTLKGHKDTVLCVTAIGQDCLASVSDDTTVKIWGLRS